MQDSNTGRDRQAQPSTLWAQVAHDLRQPIQSALLLNHVLSTTGDAAQRAQTARHMESALLGLQSMLDALSHLSGLEAGLKAADRKPCGIPDLCRRAIEALGDIPAARGVRLKSDITPGTVSSDITLLGTMLRSLLLIALDAAAGGPIKMKGRWVSGGYRIAVQFRGAAISVAQQQAAFIEFRHRTGQHTTGELLHGLGFVTRLCEVLGCSLECTALTHGGQRLALVLPGASAAVVQDD